MKLRQQLGEPADSIARFSSPLDEATSRSPDAIQLLTKGYHRHLPGDVREALTFYERAVEIDPGFALAHAARSAAYSLLHLLEVTERGLLGLGVVVPHQRGLFRIFIRDGRNELAKLVRHCEIAEPILRRNACVVRTELGDWV